MPTKVRRKNLTLLGWVRAVTLALVTYAALLSMNFTPGWGAAAIALAAGVLTLAAVDVGLIVAIIALALPLTAANAIAGIAFVVLGIIGIRYLGADGGRVFFVVAGAVAGAFLGPVWAAPVLAGYMIGASEGWLAAALACLSVEALGVVLGKPTIGAVLTGGSKATTLVDFAKGPDSYFAVKWVSETFGNVGPETVNTAVDSISKVDAGIGLLLQPAIWALAALVAARMAKLSRTRRSPLIGMSGAAGAVLIAAAGSAIAASVSGTPLPVSTIASATFTSLLVTLVVVFIWDRVFALERVQVAGPAVAGPASMAAEDADVDELLRLIATAEEKLATDHTTDKIIMITDMKAFSRMTEEDGSMLTAKAIQRHRDLLLPIIERNGGHGKSTGGDGLVAAFSVPTAAMLAAVQMQQALTEHNLRHDGERELFVRIGIADGEVVLDKGGRPFIGAALNLAARVMNLADGGQAFCTATVAAKAGGAVKTHSHGAFDLKNIAQPVDVVEILWHDDQVPVDPRQREAS